MASQTFARLEKAYREALTQVPDDVSLAIQTYVNALAALTAEQKQMIESAKTALRARHT